MKKKLRVSPDLSLPLDAATETFGILAKKGAGKSNAAVVMAEEMWDAGIPWVAIDPKGDWWGLRSSGDGKEPGLPLPVFGGRHGDIPLEASAGVMMADLILDQMLTCVLDVSEFSKADVSKFLIAFADRLYRQAQDEPIHLFLEEAHEYLPQRVMRDEAKLVGAWQKIVKQGRFKGIGCTLISQRSASLNKDVLTQVDTLIVLRTTSPQDRAAVKGWVEVHAESHDMLDTLPSLENGEAWVWSPEFMGTLERIKFRKRRTFDSGATPKVGQTRRAPATLADVDLESIRSQMADTIEKVKANDPAELKREIKRLQLELKKRPSETVEKIVEVERVVEVPYVPKWVGEDLDVLGKAVGELDSAIQRVRERAQASATTAPKSEPVSRLVKTPPRPVKPAPQPVVVRDDENATPITGGALRMLEALGQHRDLVVTRAMLGTLARLKSTSGTFSNYLSNLKTQGLIEVNGKQVQITDAGMDYLGHDTIEPKTAEERQQQWREVLSGGALRMFDYLIRVYPYEISRELLAEEVELSQTSGTYSNYLSILRTNNLIEEDSGHITASRTLFL